MIFKDILVADVQQRKARYVTFEQGLNVITSSENHVGKSSIIKSLYNTLGAEVNRDTKWDKNSKLSAVTIDVDGKEYRIVRFLKRFAVFIGTDLILLTDSVSKDLTQKLGEIFNFSVYLAKKDGQKEVIQAPPAFTFIPYYIDQDNGWSDLYNSFESLEQFTLLERKKSIYYHLGIYTKERIEKQAQKDILMSELSELQAEENRLEITINALTVELSNIVPAENEEELEQFMTDSKESIDKLVKSIGNVRNKIQQLQTTLNEHEYQFNTIRHLQTSTTGNDRTKKESTICPRCGYVFDDDLYSLVRDNYNQSNEEYLIAQIQLIITNITNSLREQEKQYIGLMAELKKQEKAYDETQDSYNLYLRHIGLADTLKKYRRYLAENRQDQSDKADEIKKISNELKKVPNKKTTEDTYITYVKSNLLHLEVWDPAYEDNIKLLKAIKVQGSLTPKIIISQYIGLFQTMDEIHSNVIRFPFVIDSPRTKEPSDASSTEILNFIIKNTNLPQIILATVDYDRFGVEDNGKVNKIYFDKKFSVLNEETYSVFSSEIDGLYALLTNMK